jgi:hypothetical protein
MTPARHRTDIAAAPPNKTARGDARCQSRARAIDRPAIVTDKCPRIPSCGWGLIVPVQAGTRRRPRPRGRARRRHEADRRSRRDGAADGPSIPTRPRPGAAGNRTRIWPDGMRARPNNCRAAISNGAVSADDHAFASLHEDTLNRVIRWRDDPLGVRKRHGARRRYAGERLREKNYDDGASLEHDNHLSDPIEAAARA